MGTIEDVEGRMHIAPITTVSDLEERLSRPSADLVEYFRHLRGDILMLGAGGKVGPTLCRMAARAIAESGVARKVMAVSRFTDDVVRKNLEVAGVEVYPVDLSTDGAFDTLPEAENILYLLGRKFGSAGSEWRTWHCNVFLAGLAAKRYRDSRIVMYSSGNIYPFLSPGSGGATESTLPTPLGEYAMSCLGRERAFDYAASEYGTKVLQFRLNYAAELRYGVIRDVAEKVWEERPIDLSTGHFNAVWQGYVSDVTLRCFELADSPAACLNITGPETISIRWLADSFGSLFGREVHYIGESAPTALLSNAARCFHHFGYPEVSLQNLIEWTAWWIANKGASHGKATHYETRDGKF